MADQKMKTVTITFEMEIPIGYYLASNRKRLPKIDEYFLTANGRASQSTIDFINTEHYILVKED